CSYFLLCSLSTTHPYSLPTRRSSDLEVLVLFFVLFGHPITIRILIWSSIIFGITPNLAGIHNDTSLVRIGRQPAIDVLTTGVNNLCFGIIYFAGAQLFNNPFVYFITLGHSSSCML